MTPQRHVCAAFDDASVDARLTCGGGVAVIWVVKRDLSNEATTVA